MIANYFNTNFSVKYIDAGMELLPSLKEECDAFANPTGLLRRLLVGMVEW